MTVDVHRYLSLEDAAQRVARAPRTLRRWVAQGALPNTLRCRQRLMFDPADLDALFEPANQEAFEEARAAGGPDTHAAV